MQEAEAEALRQRKEAAAARSLEEVGTQTDKAASDEEEEAAAAVIARRRGGAAARAAHGGRGTAGGGGGTAAAEGGAACAGAAASATAAAAGAVGPASGDAAGGAPRRHKPSPWVQWTAAVTGSLELLPLPLLLHQIAHVYAARLVVRAALALRLGRAGRAWRAAVERPGKGKGGAYEVPAQLRRRRRRQWWRWQRRW